MAFDTYPLPENSPKLEDIQRKLDNQIGALTPMVTKIYQGIDDRLNSQQSVLNKVEGKIRRAINGRIKAQGAALSNVGSSVVSALDLRIADQGQQLALQSALLPRLAPQGGVQQPSLGSPQVTPSIRFPSMGGAGLVTPQGPTIPLPPGVATPPFSLSPAEVLPSTAQQAAQSPTATGGGDWIIVVDCDQKIAMAMVRDDPGWTPKIQQGHFVPIRFNVPHVNTIAYDWVQRYAPDAIGIACHAFQNQGNGWPNGGDFQTLLGESEIVGVPVGDWPFDQYGRYTGQ